MCNVWFQAKDKRLFCCWSARQYRLRDYIGYGEFLDLKSADRSYHKTEVTKYSLIEEALGPFSPEQIVVASIVLTDRIRTCQTFTI